MSDIKDSVILIQELQAKEDKAVCVIKANPRYFFSYNEGFAKVKPSVSPIKDSSGYLQSEPLVKAELLQDQYGKVFTDPSVANIGECTTILVN